MRARITVLSCCVAATGCAGQNFAELGHPLINKKVVLEWKLGTNSLPGAMNLYKIASTKWSPAFLTNVVQLLQFRNPEGVLKVLIPATKGRNVLYTDDPTAKARRSILLNPSNGRLFFHSDYAIAQPRQPIQGVPSEEEVMSKSLGILTRLGISSNELRTKPGSRDLFRMRDVRTRSSGRDPEKKVIARGVHLFRAVDGIGLAGVGVCGGLHVTFGNDGKIAQMEFVWRNIHSPRRVQIADTNQIAKWIRQGRAVIETEADPAAITRLTVTNATVFYFGNNGSEPQSRMYPFVSLGAVAEVNDSKVPVSVNCPIISD